MVAFHGSSLKGSNRGSPFFSSLTMSRTVFGCDELHDTVLVPMVLFL